MTVMQKRLLKNLETSTTLMEAGRKAGYSSKSGNIYRNHIKKHIVEAIGNDPAKIIARYEDLICTARVKGDLSTERACIDSLARINAMFRDRAEIDITKTVNVLDLSQSAIEQAKKILNSEEVKRISDNGSDNDQKSPI